MSAQWETARHCQIALSVFAAKIRQAQSDPNKEANAHSYALRRRGEAETLDPSEQREQKRARLNSYPGGSQNNPHGASADDTGMQGHASQPDESHPTMMTGPRDTTAMGVQTGLESGQRPFQPANFGGEPSLADTPSSLALDFHQTDASQLFGGSNFDLNMVDLLQGANFDSLFDIIGQQYPSF